MNSGMKSRPRVAMIVTRSLTEDVSISRVRILGLICKLFENNFETSVFRIRTIIDAKKLKDWSSVCWMAIVGIATFKPIPLQCMLFAASSEIKRLTREISQGDFDVVYLDSVRTWGLLRSLRKSRVSVRVVVDFDDLMSRRMEMLSENRWSLSLGYLQNKLPRVIQKSVDGWLSGVITKYEAWALHRVEREMCKDAQVVVLVSPAESELLRKQMESLGGAKVCSIVPSRRAVVSKITLRRPYRFVFIGGDVHGQNRLSLNYLADLWTRCRPDAQLHIYGRQNLSWPDVHNVFWHGFVNELWEVYSEDSIAVLPALRAGGIKTKMIEAWAYGRPVLANPTAFEGLDVSGYPLIVPEAKWGEYIGSPESCEKLWWRAAEIGNEFVRKELSEQRYLDAWREAMWPKRNF